MLDLLVDTDEAGHRFADILIRRVGEGLRVRVMVDYFTLMVLSDVFIFPGYLISRCVRREYRDTRRMLDDLRKSGAEVKDKRGFSQRRGGKRERKREKRLSLAKAQRREEKR